MRLGGASSLFLSKKYTDEAIYKDDRHRLFLSLFFFLAFFIYKRVRANAIYVYV